MTNEEYNELKPGDTVYSSDIDHWIATGRVQDTVEEIKDNPGLRSVILKYEGTRFPEHYLPRIGHWWLLHHDRQEAINKLRAELEKELDKLSVYEAEYIQEKDRRKQ